jgi:N-acetyl-1-D-myo-inositol-2-amino-2-deoxy-alpha-D-glucopyranoside deacetylase
MAELSELPEHRLLLVHAHPDDESINNGATMAQYVAEGRGVTLVTCTLGEEGEVLVPELAHLAADHEDGLGTHRTGELEAAMSELGVTDFRLLGGAGRYRDSGMEWDETMHAKPKDTVRDDTFWRADLTEAATLLVEIIRELRPQVLVTYDEFGNYGHPDHIQAHRVAMYGASLAAVPSYRPDLGEPWEIAKIYWTAMSLSGARREAELMAERGIDNPFEGFDLDNPPRFMVPDEAIACEVDGTEYADAKMAAMKAHATQIQVDGPFFALSNSVGNHVWGLEHYRLAKGRQGPVDERGWESDLFAGL